MIEEDKTQELDKIQELLDSVLTAFADFWEQYRGSQGLKRACRVR